MVVDASTADGDLMLPCNEGTLLIAAQSTLRGESLNRDAGNQENAMVYIKEALGYLISIAGPLK